MIPPVARLFISNQRLEAWSAEGKLAYLDLIWAGPAMSSETFYTWEMESMQVAGETSPLSLRDVIDRHGGEVWYQREKAAHRAFFRFVLPVATPDVGHDDERARGSNRPEYYDFDLFQIERVARLRPQVARAVHEDVVARAEAA